MFLKKFFGWRSTPQEPSLTIRFTTAADQQRVLNFYTENQHEAVYQRKADLWNERTSNGRVIIAEDADNNIGFSSIAYDFYDDGKIKWVEFGSTTGQQNPEKEPYKLIKGLNLYPSIIASQTIHEFLDQTPEDKFIASIFETNKPVINMLHNKVGWNFFTPDPNIVKAKNTTKDDGNEHALQEKELWLEASPDTLPKQAQAVLDMIDKGTSEGLYNKKTDTYIQLDVSSFSLANEFRTAVEAIASGPVADYFKQNPQMSLRDARDYLEKHLQTQLKSPHPNPS